MSSEAEQNKTLVHRFFEARVKLDLDALDKMLAPDFVSHTRGLPATQRRLARALKVKPHELA